MQIRIPLFLLAFFSTLISIAAQEEFIEINDVKMHVLVKGLEERQVGAPIAIFENGAGLDLKNWGRIIERIAPDIPCMAYDRSGVGYSEDNGRYPTLQNRAEDLKELLAELKIAPPYILVGHSMGGIYIRGYAGIYPEEVAGLVFVDPADFTESREEWEAPFRSIGVDEAIIKRRAAARVKARDDYPKGMKLRQTHESENLRSLRKTDFQAFDTLRMSEIPILFFVGGKFDVPPKNRIKEFDHEDYFYARLKQWIIHWNAVIDNTKAGGWLVNFNYAGHLVHWDEPDGVAANIQAFYKKVQVHLAKGKKD